MVNFYIKMLIYLYFILEIISKTHLYTPQTKRKQTDDTAVQAVHKNCSLDTRAPYFSIVCFSRSIDGRGEVCRSWALSAARVGRGISEEYLQRMAKVARPKVLQNKVKTRWVDIGL